MTTFSRRSLVTATASPSSVLTVTDVASTDEWPWCQQTRLGAAMKCAGPSSFFRLFLHHQQWGPTHAADRRQMPGVVSERVVETSLLWSNQRTHDSFLVPSLNLCVCLHDYFDFH